MYQIPPEITSIDGERGPTMHQSKRLLGIEEFEKGSVVGPRQLVCSGLLGGVTRIGGIGSGRRGPPHGRERQLVGTVVPKGRVQRSTRGEAFPGSS